MAENEGQVQTATATAAPAGFGVIDMSKLPVVAKDALTPEMRDKAERIAKAIDLKDQAGLLNFGADPQRKAADMAEQVIGNTRARNAGPVGDLLNGMLIDIKSVSVDKLQGHESVLSKIPLIGGMFDQAKEFVSKFETVSSKIDKTEELLEKEEMGMRGSIQTLDAMYGSNLELVRDLEAYIEGGRIKLDEFSKAIPQMMAEAQSSGDAMRIQEVNDLVANARRLEKRVYDLSLSRQLGIQTAPQLRMMQSSAADLAEKLRSSVLLTIPLWKQQMAVGIELFKQKKAAQIQKSVSDTTNEMLLKNSEMLRTGQVEIARESERGIIDLDTLRKTQANLIGSIEETMKIHEDGKKARQEGMVEIEKMEAELKTKLADLSKASR